jgi:hypothetical protein
VSGEIEAVHQPLIREAAEALDGRIRRMAHTIHGNIEAIARLVEEAKDRRIHLALGFPSWTAYLADALGGQRVALPVESRKELVCYLADEGMSERAIATVTGTAKTTVHRDLEHGDASEAGGPSGPPERIVTGVDGKTYRKPPPRPPQDHEPRRKPITDAFFAATYELGRVVGRIGRLGADDRFNRNREALALRASDLIRARQVLTSVIDQLQADQTDLFDGKR